MIQLRATHASPEIGVTMSGQLDDVSMATGKPTQWHCHQPSAILPTSPDYSHPTHWLALCVSPGRNAR